MNESEGAPSPDGQGMPRNGLTSALDVRSSAIAALIPRVAGAIRALAAQPIEENGDFGGRVAAAISNALKGFGDSSWSEALENLLEKPGRVTDDRQLTVKSIILKATGEVCGSYPGELELRFARYLRELLLSGDGDFELSFEQELRRSPEAKSVLVCTLRSRISNFRAVPSDLALSFAGDVALFADGREQSYRLVDCWRAPPFVRPIAVHDLYAYRVLRRVDAQAFLQVLESLPHPELGRQVIDDGVPDASIEDLCVLLRRAGPAFGENEARVVGKEASFFILAACSRCFSAMARSLGSGSRGATDAIRHALQSILSALASRADGAALGYAWLQFLISSAHEGWQPRSQENAKVTLSAALLTILNELGTWLPLHRDANGWVAQEINVWRNYRIYSLLVVSLSRDPVDGETLGRFIVSILADDLSTSGRIERLGSAHGALERHIVGLALAAIPHPEVWFEHLWSSIFRLRDRGRRNGPLKGDVHPNVGQVAVFWGLCGLGYLDARSGSARALWARIELAVREGSLTDSHRTAEDPWDIAARWLGKYWPAIFGDDPQSGRLGSLDDFLSYWVGPDASFARLLLELRKSGVSIAQLRRSVPNGELLRAAEKDAARISRRHQNRESLSAEIRELANDLDRMDTG